MRPQYQEICDDLQAPNPKYRIMCSDYPAMRRVQFEASVWDPEKWPESDVKEQATIIKTKAQKCFLLTNNDMMRLGYAKRWHYYESKHYSVREVERTAWEKYGGPSGLRAAQEAKYPKDWRKTGKKTVAKTKSSRSNAKTNVEDGHSVAGPSTRKRPAPVRTSPHAHAPKTKHIFVPKVEDVIEID